MNTPQLSDMEDLINQCINSQPRELMKEALSCYNSKSYRSAIITIWHAVCFDFCLKIKELEIDGDNSGELKKIITALSSAKDELIKNNKPNLIVNFEKEIADKYLQNYLGLSRFESGEIKKIYEDRHIASHPALYDEEIPDFTPEKVRVHFVHAIKFLLSKNFYPHQNYLDSVKDFIKSNKIRSEKIVNRHIEKNYINIRPNKIEKLLNGLLFNIGISENIEDEDAYGKFSYLIISLKREYCNEYETLVNKFLKKLIETRKNEDFLLCLSAISYAKINDENIEVIENSIDKLNIQSIHKFIAYDHIEINNPKIFDFILKRLGALIEIYKEKLMDKLPDSLRLNRKFSDYIVNYYLSYQYRESVTLNYIHNIYEEYIHPIQQSLTKDQFERIFDKILSEYADAEKKKPKGFTVYYRNKANQSLWNEYEQKYKSKYKHDEIQILTKNYS